VTVHLLVHLPKEFKTFVVRLDPLLQHVKKGESFDFQDYFDITKKIKKDSARPDYVSICSYLFDQPSQIPEKVLRLANIDSSLLAEGAPKVLEEFKEYRLEKNTIKSIKYKAEIIKINQHEEEEWRAVNNVCKALVVKDRDEPGKLKYKKYRHLDISNLKRL
jgi:hypothetical protein